MPLADELQSPPEDSTNTTSDYRRDRLRRAGRGLKRALREGSTVFVHVFVAVTLAAVAWTVSFRLSEWIVLTICIAGVFAAELFSTAIQRIAQAIDPGPNKPLEHAQEIAQGAVLVAVLGASAILVLLFTARISSWW